MNENQNLSIEFEDKSKIIKLCCEESGVKLIFELSLHESEALAELLKGAICLALGDSSGGGRFSKEKLDEFNKCYREDNE